MQTIALTACPICHADESTALDAGEGHVLRECVTCGAVYAPEYARHEEVFVDGYLSGDGGQFGVDVSHPRFHEWLVRCGHRRMKVIETATGLSSGSLCDLGCGTGELLVAARERGWQIQGVEPLRDAAAHARDALGLPVITTTIEESGLPEQSFDVISAMHVLEHMPSAIEFLTLMARWVKPGGYIALESPNWASIQRIVSGPNWMHLRPLEHLIHLTPDSVQAAIVNAGLEPVTVRTTAHLDRTHTLDEALAALGRPHWGPRLARLAVTRDVAGQPAKVPTAPLRALLHAIQLRDERRGTGAALLAVARKPA